MNVPAILWLTGVPSVGKSTLAKAVAARIGDQRAVEVLDGDAVRANLSSDLGYSKADRDANVRRIGYVARLLAKHGVLTIVAAISPYAGARDDVRRVAQAEGTCFVEVYLKASMETLVARDVKGHYRRALAGELANFTGVSDPYEPPQHPELVIETDVASIDGATDSILALLVERGVVPAAARA